LGGGKVRPITTTKGGREMPIVKKGKKMKKREKKKSISCDAAKTLKLCGRPRLENNGDTLT